MFWNWASVHLPDEAPSIPMPLNRSSRFSIGAIGGLLGRLILRVRERRGMGTRLAFDASPIRVWEPAASGWIWYEPSAVERP